ncbi:hypothetical protein Pfo_013856 [Paulownia fortunei]|nr:hypothetical protein Pfo_013856 [Paulownia fortunei]
METQILQLATEFNTKKYKGKLPSDTKINPMEYCKAIQLRSGTEIKGLKMKCSNNDKPMENTSGQGPMEEQPKEEERQSNEQIGAEKLKSIHNFETSKFNVPIPFPKRYQKKKIDSQFAKFLEIFKKIHINIPFANALEQMPNHAKFIKDVMSRKRQLVEFETVNLTEKCSAILQKKLPQKLKDLGSFTIPCTIEGSFFDKALYDLGASINLIPFSTFRKLGIREVKPSTITLQLVDRSLTCPRRVVEDELVKVDKFIFPADFVVLDMEEDQEILLILGQPFFATERALIDVQRSELILGVNEDEVMFNIYHAFKFQEKPHACNMIEMLETCLHDHFLKQIPTKPLEQCIVHSIMQGNHHDIDNDDLMHYLLFLESREVELNKDQCKETIVDSTIKKQTISPKLKTLPEHLWYEFLGANNIYPVIISVFLSPLEVEKLLRVLR